MMLSRSILRRTDRDEDEDEDEEDPLNKSRKRFFFERKEKKRKGRALVIHHLTSAEEKERRRETKNVVLSRCVLFHRLRVAFLLPLLMMMRMRMRMIIFPREKGRSPPELSLSQFCSVLFCVCVWR